MKGQNESVVSRDLELAVTRRRVSAITILPIVDEITLNYTFSLSPLTDDRRIGCFVFRFDLILT